MRKDCKKEAKDFNNGVHELAYTLGQVLARVTQQICCCMLSTQYLLHTCSAIFRTAILRCSWHTCLDYARACLSYVQNVDIVSAVLQQPVQNLAKTLTERGSAAPVPCHICSDEFEEAYNHESSVFHGASTLLCGTLIMIFRVQQRSNMQFCMTWPCRVNACYKDASRRGYDRYSSDLGSHLLLCTEYGYACCLC